MWSWDQLVNVIGPEMLVLENVWHNLFADATWFDILLTYVMKFMHFTQDLTVQIQATAIFMLWEHEAHKHLQTN